MDGRPLRHPRTIDAAWEVEETSALKLYFSALFTSISTVTPKINGEELFLAEEYSRKTFLHLFLELLVEVNKADGFGGFICVGIRCTTFTSFSFQGTCRRIFKKYSSASSLKGGGSRIGAYESTEWWELFSSPPGMEKELMH